MTALKTAHAKQCMPPAFSFQRSKVDELSAIGTTSTSRKDNWL